MAVTWDYNAGTQVLSCTIDDAIPGDHYRLFSFDDDSFSSEHAAVGTTDTWTLTSVGGSPSRSFFVGLFHRVGGGSGSAVPSDDCIEANVFFIGVSDTVGDPYQADNWAYDGDKAISVDVIAEAGIVYDLYSTGPGSYELLDSQGPFSAGHTFTLSGSMAATPTAGRSFTAFIENDDSPFQDFADRVFVEGAAGSGKAGNPVGDPVGGGGGPTIDSITPDHGCPGDTIVIAGSGFTGTTAVTLDGLTADFTVISDTEIDAVVPPLFYGTGSWVVTTPAGSDSSGTFTRDQAPTNDGYPRTSRYDDPFDPLSTSPSGTYWIGDGSGGCLDATNRCAGAQAGEPDPAPGTPARHSVWFTWDGQGDGTYRFWLESGDSDFTDGILSVYDYVDSAASPVGDPSVLGAAIAQGDDELGTMPQADAPITAGNPYVIQVDCRDLPGGAFTLRWVRLTGSPPANDDFANRITLTGASGSEAVDTTNATAECDEPGTFPIDDPHNSVWYEWTPPQDGAVRFSAVGTAIYSIFEIFTGATLETLALVDTGDQTGEFIGAGTREVWFEADNSVTYKIRVQGQNGDVDDATIVLSWEMESATPPANDDFADATPLDLCTILTVDLDINGATLEAGEQNPTLPFIDDALLSVWWTFTLTDPGFFAIQMLADLPLGGRIELWQGDTLAGLSFQKAWHAYPTNEPDETFCLGAGTYYVRAAARDWTEHLQFRMLACDQEIKISVGTIDAGDPSIVTSFTPGVDVIAGLVLFTVGLDTNDPYEEGFQFSGGVCDKALNQAASSSARPYEHGGVVDPGHSTFDAAKALVAIDQGGTVIVEAVVDAFNADGTIDLSWPTQTADMKIGYWAVANIESAVQTIAMDFDGGSVDLTTDWKVKALVGLGGYFALFSVDGGGGGGDLPNVGATFGAKGAGGVSSAIGIRMGEFGGPNQTDNLVTVGTGGAGDVGYLDGAGDSQGIAADRSGNDGVAFSWPGGEPPHDTVEFAFLALGGLGWTTRGATSPEGEAIGGTYPAAFRMAGALATSAGSVAFPDIYSNPSFPYPGFPSEKRGDHGDGEWVGVGAWDLESNQWVGIAGGRAYNTAHSDGIFHSDSPSWHGWFGDRVGYALDDYDSMPWYRTIVITDDQHGTTTDHGSKPVGAVSEFLVFGSYCSHLRIVSFAPMHYTSTKHAGIVSIR